MDFGKGQCKPVTEQKEVIESFVTATRDDGKLSAHVG